MRIVGIRLTNMDKKIIDTLPTILLKFFRDVNINAVLQSVAKKLDDLIYINYHENIATIQIILFLSTCLATVK